MLLLLLLALVLTAVAAQGTWEARMSMPEPTGGMACLSIWDTPTATAIGGSAQYSFVHPVQEDDDDSGGGWVQMYDYPTDTWETASLGGFLNASEGMSGETVPLLGPGFVTGGERTLHDSGTQVTAASVAYNQPPPQLSGMAPLPQARAFGCFIHEESFLSGGLYVGGYDQFRSPRIDVFEYDISTDAWTPLDVPSNLPQPRAEHACSIYPPNWTHHIVRGFVIGGWVADGPSATMLVVEYHEDDDDYLFVSDAAPDMPQALAGLVASVDANYVFAGLGYRDEQLDPRSFMFRLAEFANQWESVPVPVNYVNTQIAHACAATIPYNGAFVMMVYGGYDTEADWHGVTRAFEWVGDNSTAEGTTAPPDTTEPPPPPPTTTVPPPPTTTVPPTEPPTTTVPPTEPPTTTVPPTPRPDTGGNLASDAFIAAVTISIVATVLMWTGIAIAMR